MTAPSTGWSKESFLDTQSLLPVAARHAALAILPDDGRYKARFDIASESSDRVYRISFDSAPGARWWKCSCPGNIRFGNCKHLKAMGLPGRQAGSSAYWSARLLGAH